MVMDSWRGRVLSGLACIKLRTTLDAQIFQRSVKRIKEREKHLCICVFVCFIKKICVFVCGTNWIGLAKILDSEFVTLMGPTRSNIRQRKMQDSLSKYYSIFLFFYLNAPHPLTLFLQFLKPKRTITSRKHFQLQRLLSLSKYMGAWLAKLAFISFLDQKVGGGDNAKEIQ